MDKRTIGVIAVLILVFGGMIFWSSLNAGSKINYDLYDSSKVIAADDNNGNIGDHYRGKENASVIIVEYADLQCPGCATMMPKMSKLYEQYGDRVGFIFRSYPISGHQNARSASAAAEAAAKQGFFWEMIETMYDNRADWISIYDTEKRTRVYANFFEEVSGGNGDVEKFKNDLNDSNIQKKIDFDKGLGAKKDNVDATPAIYINGNAIDIEHTDKYLKDVIEEQINILLEKAGEKTGPNTTEKA